MDKTSSIIPDQLRRTIEENEFISRNKFYLVLIFSCLWFSYCWWLSEQYDFDFGEYTIIVRLLFCIIHVLTVWKLFQYIIKLAFRLYQLSRRLRIILIDYLSMIGLTFVLFLLLTFVFNFKEFLREVFTIVD
jgi:hypothetical protein